MELSIRKHFRQDEDGWADYIAWIGLPYLSEVRTQDRALNPHVAGLPFPYQSREDVVSGLHSLPEIDGTRHYHLLAVNLEEDEVPALPEGTILLGYDVADETRTSSLLNCGPWRGKLAPLAARLNRYGLLALEDARLAQRLLPEEWGEEEPHACVDIWALYEVAALPPGADAGVAEV